MFLQSSEFLNYALGISALIGTASLVYVAHRFGEVRQASKAVLEDVETITRSAREAKISIVSLIRRVRFF